MDEKMLWSIRLIRMLSACAEVTAAILLLRMTDVRAMIRLNGLLGLVGPLIFISVSALGIAASLGKVQPQKLLLILAGVILVLWGTR
ncbi:MAG: YqhV family protein [Bacillota bacterium]